MSVSDCCRRVLPGTIQKCALTSICEQPLRVLSVQGAGQLPVWLLRGAILDQHGEAECGPTPSPLLNGVQCDLCFTQLRTWNLHFRCRLQEQAQDSGGGQVSGL